MCEAVHRCQLDCQQITSRMEAKLPTELRDMIYMHICVADEPVPIIPIANNVPYDSPEYDLLSDEEPMQPHSRFMNPSWVGKTMSQDAAKLYYSRNTFEVSVGPEKWYHDLGVFLRVTPFWLKITPYRLVRSLIVNVKMEYFWQLVDYMTPTELDKSKKERELLLQTYNSIKCLALLEDRKRLSLIINILTRFDSESGFGWHDEDREFLNFLEVVRAPVYEMIESGVDITVVHENSFRGRMIQRDLTECFRSTINSYRRVSQPLPNILNVMTNRPAWGKELWPGFSSSRLLFWENVYERLEIIDAHGRSSYMPNCAQRAYWERWHLKSAFLFRPHYNLREFG